jgi:hypothetical protein
MVAFLLFVSSTNARHAGAAVDLAAAAPLASGNRCIRRRSLGEQIQRKNAGDKKWTSENAEAKLKHGECTNGSMVARAARTDPSVLRGLCTTWCGNTEYIAILTHLTCISIAITPPTLRRAS